MLLPESVMVVNPGKTYRFYILICGVKKWKNVQLLQLWQDKTVLNVYTLSKHFKKFTLFHCEQWILMWVNTCRNQVYLLHMFKKQSWPKLCTNTNKREEEGAGWKKCSVNFNDRISVTIILSLIKPIKSHIKRRWRFADIQVERHQKCAYSGINHNIFRTWM